MKNLRVKCPAKINLTLEIINKREDGFHNIKSIMQLIDLYDYLDISVEKSDRTKIVLSGNSNEIPYNEKNIVFKATDTFLKKLGDECYTISINIDKNIPVAAGLAGGSTDAAGTIFGLNTVFDNILSDEELNELCASLGSDLNVCLNGGCLLATSRGEFIEHLPVIEKTVTLIKPKNLGISAKEAYTKYSEKDYKPQNNMTEKMTDALISNEDITPYLYNDLEYAIFEDYEELKYIKRILPDSIMSGSGSTYFLLRDYSGNLGDDYQIIRNLHFISNGVQIDQ
ncbi:4-(cytidine 5'-diphospho)-2-C-methyl-D-erythritol kinase [bacterium]|nr:4-(cytidine 5'-diphospho)-2-C-methyl-D-erythritol kinase [bacterium]